jgi:hypothetical protein
MENDWIQGVVVKILTGNTFLLKLNFIMDEFSDRIYQKIEQIRISDMPAEDPLSYDGIMARNRLNARFLNQKVHCTVISREPDNHLLCKVKLL